MYPAKLHTVFAYTTVFLTTLLAALNEPLLLASTAVFQLQTTPAELLGFALALAMVYLNMHQLHWGWWCALLSSVLYFWVFANAKLYAEAGLQVVFAALSVWGGLTWLGWVGRSQPSTPPPTYSHTYSHTQLQTQPHTQPCIQPHTQIQTASAATLWRSAAAGVACWLAVVWMLKTYTDADLPIWDAAATAASLVATVWTATKYVQNWPLWLAVNVFSCGLFAYKGLVLTALLYALLAVAAGLGWRRWSAELAISQATTR